MKIISYVPGLLMFALFNRIELRYLLPVPRIPDLVERGRRRALVLMGARIPPGSFVRSALYITAPRYLTMGDGSKIGPRSQLFLYAQLTIGNNVEIGSDLIVHTAEHVYESPDKPICKQGAQYKPVRVGDNVYIGSRVTLLPGACVQSNVVIAAGAVVRDTLASGYVYGGVPAKPLKRLPGGEK